MRYNDYDRSLHTTYASGRAFAPRMENFWEELLAPHVRRGDRCLDVGCGTGRFPPLLAQLPLLPAAKTIDDQRLPGAARLDGAFERAAHRDRLRTRAVSTFEFLSEVEIESGFAAVDSAVAANADPGPISDPIKLVAYRRRDEDEYSDPTV